MHILLEELPHQNEALKAMNKSFLGLDMNVDNNDIFANPLIKARFTDEANIDIKMETGTGKTYVGVRTMYDLHQKYGLFKFIVVVPSPAIKEGWKNFIEADYAKQHFSQFYENTSINLNVINSGDFNSSKGLLPANLVDFVEGDSLNSATIQVLLINSQMLNSSNMQGVYTSGKNKGQERFNQTMLSGFTKPLEGLQATKPIVIMDEPHRFPRGKAYYKAVQELKPQMIIRFGATFPEVIKGRGKNKVTLKDYYRKKPQFNLNSASAFNQGLVKGIDIYYPQVTESESKDKYVVDKVINSELILKHNKEKLIFKKGDDIGLGGDISYVGNKELSNGLEIEKGMTFLPATMTTSYQELIIKDAIDKHFDAEIKNFLRDNDNQAKIKTISLFFIDSIPSYGVKQEGVEGRSLGWLGKIFETLLKEKLEKLIREFRMKNQAREQEYLSFLQATLKNLETNVHAGYFGEDRGTGDEAIQAEVADILSNKEKLLSFKDKKGNWETRRFLFSKWTLREGWDNPNVFVLAKLRTSGSETSKIQEVGRGLRLPVDENGHRVQQTEWDSRLSYLIGYDEKDFANKLVDEANADVVVELNEIKLTEDMIKFIIENTEVSDADTLLRELDQAGIINRSNEFINNGFEKLTDMYPVLLDVNVLRPDKKPQNNPINPDKNSYVKLKKNNWDKMRDLWETFSSRYMLEFDSIGEDALQLLIDEVMNKQDNFQFQYSEYVHNEIIYDEDGKLKISEHQGDYSSREPREGMKYGKFIERIARATRLTPAQIHRSLLPVLRDRYDGNTKYLNDYTLNNIIIDFRKRFETKYSQSYTYSALDFQASTSVYDAEKQDFKDEILANSVGKLSDKDVSDDERQLYDMPPLRYDSKNPEKDLLTRAYNSNVISFGKLPRSAIRIPKYTGGSTTPDFVYILEREDNTYLYLLVETKAEGSGMRIGDKQIIEIQKEFFSQLDNHGIEYQVATAVKDVEKKIREMVDNNYD